MSRFGHFLYTHKLVILNIFLAGLIAGLDPRWLKDYPDTPEINYYTGVCIMVLLFFEFASIHYLGRFIYSFPRNLQRRTPWYIGISFVPRVLVSSGLALLVLSAMRVLYDSDFYLLLIVFYAAIKEFWVRSWLFNADREKTKRPSRFMNWTSAILYFLFVAGSYVSLWLVYLWGHERIMYLFLDPINWAWDLLIILVMVVSLEVPWLFEEWIRDKKRSQKVLAVCSVLLPVLAFLFTLYRMQFL